MRPTWDDLIAVACNTYAVTRQEIMGPYGQGKAGAPDAVRRARAAIAALAKEYGVCGPRETASRLGVVRSSLMYTKPGGNVRDAREALKRRMGTVSHPTPRLAEIVYADLLARRKAYRPEVSTMAQDASGTRG